VNRSGHLAPVTSYTASLKSSFTYFNSLVILRLKTADCHSYCIPACCICDTGMPRMYLWWMPLTSIDTTPSAQPVPTVCSAGGTRMPGGWELTLLCACVYVWICAHLCGYVWICAHVCGYMWMCVDICGCVWMFVLHVPVRSCNLHNVSHLLANFSYYNNIAYAPWLYCYRQRLAIYEKFKRQIPITSVKFSPRGDQMFYALSYDWSRGAENNNPSVRTFVVVHTNKLTLSC
jgi:hypothetical protein